MRHKSNYTKIFKKKNAKKTTLPAFIIFPCTIHCTSFIMIKKARVGEEMSGHKKFLTR
jgi:hypothetical protein